MAEFPTLADSRHMYLARILSVVEFVFDLGFFRFVATRLDFGLGPTRDREKRQRVRLRVDFL